MTIRAAEGELMADAVYRQLFGIILSQELMPGDRLTVDQLSRQLSVSQTPVRQALTRLQSDGLVINKRNSGFRVSELPTREHLYETLDLRLMMETVFVARAVDNAEDATIRTLEVSLNDMEALLEDDEIDLMKFYKADALFHTTIAEAAGNNVGADTLLRLLTRSTVFRLTYADKMPTDVLLEHREIFEAIKAGSKSLAVEKLEAHLTTSMDRIRGIH